MPRTPKKIVFKRPIEEAEREIARILQKYHFSPCDYNGETVWKRNNPGSGVPVLQFLKIVYTPVGAYLEAWIGTDGETKEIPLNAFEGGSAGIILSIIVEEIQAAV